MDRGTERFKTDFDSLKNQVAVETYRSRGPGGQRKNKTETSVRLKHLPTGLTVIATESRHQSENLKLAFERLRERLRRLNQKKKPRIPTRIPPQAMRKKKEEKIQHSFRKQLRQKISRNELGDER